MAIFQETSRSETNKQGCMGSIINFFDFHQRRHGTKLLTDKKNRHGTEAPRNSLDVTAETPQWIERKTEESAYERNCPAKKKSTKQVAIKSLIAEEISKGNECKRRSPGIIARLMGLDVVPEDAMSLPHIKVVAADPQKRACANYSCSVQKRSVVPTVSNCDKPAFGETSQPLTRCSAQKDSSCSLLKETRPERLQECKKQLLASRKTQVHAQSTQCNEHTNVNMLKGNKFRPSQELVHASKDLHANNEICLKFLQESNPLFEDYTEDQNSDTTEEEKLSPEYQYLRVKCNLENSRGEDGCRMDDSKQEDNTRKHLQRLKAHNFQTDKDAYRQTEALSFRKRCKDKLFSLPTRIVVLKPSKGVYQNSWNQNSWINATPPSYSPQSQTGQTDQERGRLSTHNFLLQVREKLRISFGDTGKEKSPLIQEDHNEDVCSVQGRKAFLDVLAHESISRSTGQRRGYKAASCDFKEFNSNSNENYEFRKMDGFKTRKQLKEEEKYQDNRRKSNRGSNFGEDTNCSGYPQQNEDEVFKNQASEFFCDLHQPRFISGRSAHPSKPMYADAKLKNEDQNHSDNKLGILGQLPTDVEKNDETCLDSIRHENCPVVFDSAVLPELINKTRKRSGFRVRVSDLKDTFLLRGRRSCSDKSEPMLHMQNSSYREVNSEETGNIMREKEPEIIKSKEQSYLAMGTSMQSTESQQLGINHNNNSSNKEEMTKGEAFEESHNNIWPTNYSTKSERDVCLCDAPSGNLNEVPLTQSPQSFATGPLSEDQISCFEVSNDGRGKEINPISVLESNEKTIGSALEQENIDFCEIPCAHQSFKASLENNSLAGIFGSGKLDTTCDEESSIATQPMLSDVIESPPSVDEVDLALELVKDSTSPRERFDDLLYIGNVLVSGGFVAFDSNEGIVSSNWNPEIKSFNISLYERIEECYNESTLQKNDLTERDCSDISSDDHLLFDCINETLLEVLEPYCNPQPWVARNKTNFYHMPTGKNLLAKIWTKVCSHLSSESETHDELDTILAKDLDEAGWLELQGELEEMGKEIHESILHDLIQELVHDLLDKNRS